jgi:hypothetical protein
VERRLRAALIETQLRRCDSPLPSSRKAVTAQAWLLQAWSSHARAGSPRPTQTCVGCRTGISSVTPRALLGADTEPQRSPPRCFGAATPPAFALAAHCGGAPVRVRRAMRDREELQYADAWLSFPLSRKTLAQSRHGKIRSLGSGVLGRSPAEACESSFGSGVSAGGLVAASCWPRALFLAAWTALVSVSMS